MIEIPYNRLKVLEYAQKWAYDRNPKYYNFEKIRFVHIEKIKK